MVVDQCNPFLVARVSKAFIVTNAGDGLQAVISANSQCSNSSGILVLAQELSIASHYVVAKE